MKFLIRSFCDSSCTRVHKLSLEMKHPLIFFITSVVTIRMDHKNPIFNWGQRLSNHHSETFAPWSPEQNKKEENSNGRKTQFTWHHRDEDKPDQECPFKAFTSRPSDQIKIEEKQTKEDSELPTIIDDMEAITNQIDDADLKTFSGKLFPSVEVDEIPSGTMDPIDTSQNSTSEFSDSKHHPGKSHYRILMHLGTSPNPQASSLLSVHCVSQTCT